MRKNLETYLTESGRFSSEQLGDARRTQRFFGGSLLSNMVRLGYINETEAGSLFAGWSGYPYLPFRELKKAGIRASVLETIEPEVAARRKVVPFRLEGGDLHVVTCSTDNEIFFLELGRRVNAAVVPHIMPDERVEQLLERHYRVGRGPKEAVPVPIEDAADAGPVPKEKSSFEPEDPTGLPSDLGLDGLPLDSEVTAHGNSGASMGVSLAGLSGLASRAPGGARPGGSEESHRGGEPPAEAKQAAIDKPRDSETHEMVGYARPGSGTVERPFSAPAAPDDPPASRSEPAAPDGLPLSRSEPAAPDDLPLSRSEPAGPDDLPLSRSAPVREPGSTLDGPDMQARSTGQTDRDALPDREKDPFDTAEVQRPSLDVSDTPGEETRVDYIAATHPDSATHAEENAPPHARVTDKGPLSIDNPLQILSRALDRERIGKAAVELVLSMGATRVALFSHQQERLVGWEAGGPGVNDRLFARLSLPLYAPSIFSSMRVRATPYVGIVPDQPANNEFLQTLGGTAPGLGTAVPVTLKGRLVAVLYADGGPGAQQVLPLERLQDAASKLALALEVLLLRRKILS